MSHLLSDHPDWPNASVDATPTPRVERVKNETDGTPCLIRYMIELPKRIAKLEAERDELKRHAELLPILASVWFFGDFKAETFNERLMQTIMESAGLWPIADDRDLDEKVAAYRAAQEKKP